MDVVKRTLAIWEGKTDPLPNPSKFNPEISPSISACLLKAMAVERENRFASAIEMQKALEKAIAEKNYRANDIEPVCNYFKPFSAGLTGLHKSESSPRSFRATLHNSSITPGID